MEKVSQNACRILAAMQFRANASVPEISKITSIRPHVLQYELQKLRREGVLRPWALVDFYRLGFSEYELYFSLNAEGRKKRKSIVKFLMEHNAVVWLGDLGGEYHYLVTIICRRVHELSRFVDSLVERFGNVFSEREIVNLVSLHFFTKKYLSGKLKSVETIRLGDTEKVIDIDNTDYAILSSLCVDENTSHRSLAQKLGLPRTTVDYRISQLEKKGVISAYACRMSAKYFGRSSYKFLIKTSGMGLSERQDIFNFCRKHPDIVNFFHCIGSWDIEVGVESATPPDASAVMQQMYEQFGSIIQMIKVLVVFSSAQSKFLLRGMNR